MLYVKEIHCFIHKMIASQTPLRKHVIKKECIFGRNIRKIKASKTLSCSCHLHSKTCHRSKPSSCIWIIWIFASSSLNPCKCNDFPREAAASKHTANLGICPQITLRVITCYVIKIQTYHPTQVRVRMRSDAFSFYRPRHECGYASQHSWHTWHTAGMYSMWCRGHKESGPSVLSRQASTLLIWIDGGMDGWSERWIDRDRFFIEERERDRLMGRVSMTHSTWCPSSALRCDHEDLRRSNVVGVWEDRNVLGMWHYVSFSSGVSFSLICSMTDSRHI